MTLSDLQGHSFTASLFRCRLLYICAAVDKISADIVHRVITLWWLSILYWKKCTLC